MNFFNRKPKVCQLIVGLGNPGNEYGDTRHNVGFLTLDILAGQAGASYAKLRCEALTSEGTLGKEGMSVALAKPQTFMNCSGRAIKGLLHHYCLDPSSLLIIHDDLDIPEHVLRLKEGGGHGGHNGLRDINAAIGSTYRRIRVGVGRPPGKMPADRFVLQRLNGDALEQLQTDAQLAAQAVLSIINDGFAAAQNSINAKEP